MIEQITNFIDIQYKYNAKWLKIFYHDISEGDVFTDTEFIFCNTKTNSQSGV